MNIKAFEIDRKKDLKNMLLSQNTLNILFKNLHRKGRINSV